MKALAVTLFLALSTWSTPQVICGIRIDPTAPAPVVTDARWRGLHDRDLIARTILSEQGGRVLDAEFQADAAGVGWVLWNRTRGFESGFSYARHNVYAAVMSPGQYRGMTESHNAARAADPERYSMWYGPKPHAGRLAYWTAVALAQCIIAGQLVDPTGGALFSSDHYYARGLDGSLLVDPTGAWLIRAYEDGHTRFRFYFAEQSYRIGGGITFKPGPECLGAYRRPDAVEMC